MILKGFYDKFKNIVTGETDNVTVSPVGDKVGLDVNILSGGASGGASAANQATQITEAQSTNTKLDTLISQTDTVEALLGSIDTNTAGGGGGGDASAANQSNQITEAQSTNTKLDTLISQTDTVETVLGQIQANTATAPGDASAANQTNQITEAQSTNTKLDTVIGHVDELEGELQTANTALSAISTNTSDSVNGLTSNFNELQTIKNSNTVNVSWNFYTISYVGTGSNGAGQIESIAYYTVDPSSLGATPIMTLTYTYDAEDRVIQVGRA